MTSLPKSVSAVLIHPEMTTTMILTVSRKKGDSNTEKHSPLNDFGLPGGKVEEDESTTDALEREVHEETGFLIDTTSARHVFSDVSKGFRCHSYLVTSWAGQLGSSEPATIAWVTPDVVQEDDMRFSNYNRKLFHTLDETGHI